jgi:hypothetical protein
MDFVAAGTEFGSLLAHERFQECAAMWFRIYFDHEIVEGAHHRIFAGGKFVEFRIFENEIALTHGAFHFNDAVAHHAAESGLRGGSVLDLADGSVKHSAKEQSRVVTAGTPLGSFHPGDILHVFDAFAIPLIVEGRKVVSGTIPLGVDIFVAAFAGLRLHKIFRGDIFSVFGLHGAREEFSGRAITFAVHGFGGEFGIDDAIGIFPPNGASPPGASGDPGKEQSANGETYGSSGKTLAEPATPSDPGSCYEENAKSTHRNVKKKPETETVGSADLDENEAEKRARRDQQPAKTNFQRGIAKNAAKDGN